MQTVCGNPSEVRHVDRPKKGHYGHGKHWKKFAIQAVAHADDGDAAADNGVRVKVWWHRHR